MKVAVTVFVALAAPLCLAAPQGYNYAAPAPSPAPVSYNFGYNVDTVDALGQAVQFGHQEGREATRTTGRYFVLLPDTRLMTVDYVADETGFHPTYSFQGTAVFPTPNAPSAFGSQAALASPGQLYATPGGK